MKHINLMRYDSPIALQNLIQHKAIQIQNNMVLCNSI